MSFNLRYRQFYHIPNFMKFRVFFLLLLLLLFSSRITFIYQSGLEYNTRRRVKGQKRNGKNRRKWHTGTVIIFQQRWIWVKSESGLSQIKAHDRRYELMMSKSIIRYWVQQMQIVENIKTIQSATRHKVTERREGERERDRGKKSRVNLFQSICACCLLKVTLKIFGKKQ